MRLSLKAKLTGLIALLVLLVVLATSTVYVSNTTRQALMEVESKGQYVANEVYHQARTVLAQKRMPPGSNPADPQELRRFVQSQLASDSGLQTLMESALTYSATLYYVAITDTEHLVLVGTDPEAINRPFAPAPPFGDLLQAGLVRQLRVLYGPPRIYEIVYSTEIGGQQLDFRVGVSTVFLGNQIRPDLRAAFILASVIVLFAAVSAGVLSFLLLRPLETISRGVDRLARGEFTEPMQMNRTDEWGILSSKLDLIGEQMRGEKAAFVQLKDNLDQLFSKLRDGLLLFDNQDRLVLATPAVARFVGSAPSALVHRKAADVFPGDNPLQNLLGEAFRTRRSLPWQTLDLPDADAKRVAVNVQFVEEAGARVGCLVTLRDATTRAEIQDQIDVTTRLAALSRLMSGVAHEVKNPLNAMVLQLEILRSKLAEQGTTVQPHLQVLSDEIRRLDRVVKTFLDFTRPVEIRPSQTDIPALVRDVFTLAEPHAKKNKVRLVFQGDGALPPVRWDRDLMKQALLNLVLNGCQAMPSGGELRITPRTDGHRLELEIADQGVGIPPQAQSKIFSLFFTTKPGGTGIGLAMVYRILQLHNASIDFASEVNRGTTFRLSFPL